MAKNAWQAQQEYWESFGLPAYDENTVPDDAVLPYITYEARLGELDGDMQVSASLWYAGRSWADISDKATLIQKTGNKQIKIDGGYMKVRIPADNFAQRMDEPSSNLIRRIVLRVSIEFII